MHGHVDAFMSFGPGCRAELVLPRNANNGGDQEGQIIDQVRFRFKQLLEDKIKQGAHLRRGFEKRWTEMDSGGQHCS